METPYDWITVAIFAGLVVIFLQRSVGDHEQDSILSYAPAALGCAVCNWLGNEGYDGQGAFYHIAAVAGLAALLAYIWLVIKPQDMMKR